MTSPGREIVIVRSLTDSDLGLFAARRASATSKQRAININAPAAAQLLSPELYESGDTTLDCTTSFCGVTDKSKRHFGKTHKNWRLGGNKLEGKVYINVDSRDFILIRSVEHNNGSNPVSITFIARATDSTNHARLVSLVQDRLDRSMTVFNEDDPDFPDVAGLCPALPSSGVPPARPTPGVIKPALPVPPMPREPQAPKARKRSIKDKLRSPYIVEQMIKVSSDLSAPAQLRFMETVELLATQLRGLLVETGRIIRIERNHRALWEKVAGKPIGFVDGGMANLSMLGSVPIAVRVGGYVVTPGDRTEQREKFIVLKRLIAELFSDQAGGVYDGSYPDIGALRDAARISVETAGGIQVLGECQDASWIFLHGALVNPVSRYSDVMRNGKVAYPFPNFSQEALKALLPPDEPKKHGRETNFISVYLRQLEILSSSDAIVCGVVERESHTSSVIRAVLDSLDDNEIRPLLPVPPAEWKTWFRSSIDPAEEEDGEGQRITDPLLFRCVLEPGEALIPVRIDRNDIRRAPEAWKDKVARYPKPIVSYIQPTEWNAPVRIEMFEKNISRFEETASLVLHCSLLLPKYAFPVGLDIVDRFAKIPNWMSRPVNTHTAVQALRGALDREDTHLFDALRRMMCGSQREWLLRPGINR